MSANHNGPSETPGKPALTPEIRRYLGTIGRGWKTWSHEQRSLTSKLFAPKRWATRRRLYPPTGRKQVPFTTWKSQHKGHLKANQ